MSNKRITTFEDDVIDYLTINGTGSLWWMSDLYVLCCKSLNLNINDIKANQANIRKRLSKMINNGKINVQRTRNRYASGLSNCATSSNDYTLHDSLLD